MEELFISVLNMSLTASYVIVFVMLVRLPLKNAPKVISYALWGVVAFRLICPFSFESIFSLLPASTTPIPQDIAYQQSPQIKSGIAAVDMYVNSSLSSPSAVASANPIQVYTQIGAYIWLLGIAAMLVYSVASILILKRRLKDAQYKEQNIYEAENLKTPFVLGILRPKIYIPAGLTADEKSYIIRHEQMHIRRFDHIVKPFTFLVLSIHWFNPLVWVAFVLMSTDMELSCDEKVIKEMGYDIKKAYSASLLSLASDRLILNGSPLAFGEGNVKDRIKNVLNYTKPAFWVVAAAIIVVVSVGIGLFFNPRSNTPSMTWAKSLHAEDIQSIELIVQPSHDQERYKKYEPEEFTKIVELVNQSRGKFVKNPEEIVGGGQTFYITTKDSVIHQFLNTGNKYLMIDGDAFEAGYEWLRKWNYNGDSAVPDEFWKKVTLPLSVSGGSEQGLIPYASQQTSLEPTSPKLSPGQSIGVDMVQLDYASDDTVIFHDYFGLFVYDLNSEQIVRSLDLNPIGCTATQGDDYCEFSVSADGNTVQLHPMSSKNMYVYTVSDNTLRGTVYERMENRFTGFVDIVDVIDYQKAGNYSHQAVRFDTGEYGYLHTTDWTLGTLTYSRDDIVYKLFDMNTNIVYTEEEIQAAMECVRTYFSEEATSRVLNDLWFDEEACITHRASYMQSGKGKTNGVSEENVIVLLCNFTIKNDEAFKGYYPNWKMILIRDSADGNWRIDGQGV